MLDGEVKKFADDAKLVVNGYGLPIVDFAYQATTK